MSGDLKATQQTLTELARVVSEVRTPYTTEHFAIHDIPPIEQVRYSRIFRPGQVVYHETTLRTNPNEFKTTLKLAEKDAIINAVLASFVKDGASLEKRVAQISKNPDAKRLADLAHDHIDASYHAFESVSSDPLDENPLKQFGLSNPAQTLNNMYVHTLCPDRIMTAHGFYVPFQNALHMLKTPDSEWELDNLQWQFREHSHNLTLLTLSDYNPFFLFRRFRRYQAHVSPDEWTTTNDNAAAFGLYTYSLKDAPQMMTVLETLCDLSTNYFPETKDAMQKLINIKKTHKVNTPPQKRAVLKDILEQRFKKYYDSSTLDETTRMVRTFDTIATFYGQGFNAVMNKEPIDVLPNDNSLLEFAKKATPHHISYFHRDGKQHPDLKRALHMQAGISYQVSYFFWHLLDMAEHDTKHFNQWIKRLGPLPGSIEDIRKSVKATLGGALSEIISEDNYQKLASASFTETKSLVGADGWAAVMQAHWKLLTWRLVKGSTRTIYHTGKQVIGHLKKGEISAAAYALIFHAGSDAHKLKIKSDSEVETPRAKAALDLAERMYLTNQPHIPQYSQIYEPLALELYHRPGLLKTRFAAGMLDYLMWKTTGDEGKRQDAIRLFDDIITSVDNLSRSERHSLEPGDLRYIKDTFEPAVKYWRLQATQANGHAPTKEQRHELSELYKELYKHRITTTIGKFELGEDPELFKEDLKESPENILPPGELWRLRMYEPLDFKRRRMYVDSLFKGTKQQAITETNSVYNDATFIQKKLFNQDIYELIRIREKMVHDHDGMPRELYNGLTQNTNYGHTRALVKR